MLHLLLGLILAASTVPACAAIRIDGSTVTFTDSIGAAKTVQVGLEAAGWSLPNGGRSRPFLAPNREGILICERIGLSSPTATYYNEFGGVRLQVVGGQGKFFRNALIAARPLTIALEAIPENEHGPIGSVFPGEAPGSILVYARRRLQYGFPSGDAQGYSDPELVSLSPNGRYLTLKAKDQKGLLRSVVVNLRTKKLVISDDSLEFVGVDSTGSGQLCHLLRKRGCSKVELRTQLGDEPERLE